MAHAGRGRRAPMTAAAAALAAIAATLAVGGCGSSETPPEERVQATVEVLLGGCAAEDPQVVLETLTPPLEARFVESESVARACGELLAGAIDPPAPGRAAPPLIGVEEARVSSVETEGGFASARIDGPAGSAELELELGTGSWLVTGSG